MSLIARLRLPPPAYPDEPAQGWRGGLQLALHVLVTGVIVSVLLSLAVVGVAAQAASLPLATAATASGDAYAPLLFAGGLLALAASTWLLRPAGPIAVPQAPSVEQALEQRARFAGWVC
jgi:hypothetical protein